LVVTFLVSGAIHDAAVTLVTGSMTFLLAPWFTLLGLFVVLASRLGLEYESRAWGIRAGINVGWIMAGLAVVLLAKRIFGVA
jgi:hypothetical protein